MARHRTVDGKREPAGQYHSDDPRQTSLLEEFIGTPTAGRPAVMEPVVGPGSAAWNIGDEGSRAEWVDAGAKAAAGKPTYGPSTAAFLRADSVEALAEEVRKVTGCGLSLTWATPGSARVSGLVLVGWDSLPRMERDGVSGTGRAGFFGDARTALLHVLDYERINASAGKDEAEHFHVKARCKSESEAVARLDEEAGIERVDPNRNNPKYKRGDR